MTKIEMGRVSVYKTDAHGEYFLRFLYERATELASFDVVRSTNEQVAFKLDVVISFVPYTAHADATFRSAETTPQRMAEAGLLGSTISLARVNSGNSILAHLTFNTTDGVTRTVDVHNKRMTLRTAFNSAPTMPTTITLSSGKLLAGQSVNFTASGAVDADSDPLVYEKQYSYDGIIWTTFTSAFTLTTDKKRGQLYIRSRAFDTQEYSDYLMKTFEIVHNEAPVITIASADLGKIVNAPVIKFTITDGFVTALKAAVTIDGIAYKTFASLVSGVEQTLNLADKWSTLSNGNHVLKIVADDGMATSEKSIKFAKSGNIIDVKLKNPVVTDSNAKRITGLVHASLPAGASMQVLACNNANDAAPKWETVTSAFNGSKSVHTFTNTAKTAASWAVSVRFILSKGASEDYMSLDAYGFSFD